MRILPTLFLMAATLLGQTTARGPEGIISLPVQPIGSNDLIYVWVYDSPEFTGNVRVSKDGLIRIPLLKVPVKAGGLTPTELEGEIGRVLVQQKLLVDPQVTVSVTEYQSHPISVSGAVKTAIVFQATQPVSLLEALDHAGGLAAEAGNEILVTTSQTGADGKPATLTRRVPVRELIDHADPSLNFQLSGGEEIRVPVAEKIYVAGNVKNPGAIPVQNSGDTTVMQVVAMAGGLAPFPNKDAFIYRLSDATHERQEIALPIGKIMDRKAPDVTLVANDIVYIPDNKSKRITAQAIDKLVGFGASVGTGLLIYSH